MSAADGPAAGAPRHGLDELIAERRGKLHRLRESDSRAFPHSFPGVEPIGAVLGAYEHLDTGEETDERHRVAGRLAARRGSGKAAFLDLVDRSGKIQLHARQDVLGEERFAELVSLDLGDLLGVDGAAMRSRHGEISLRVEDFEILGKALRPPPDKHHGLTDVETRYRHRELDLIASEESRRLFVDRARIISAVRGALDGDGFIEVETPVLQALYGGALARPFVTHHNALDRDLYLRIATELYLKRLIVGGLERVYELGKDFRNEGVSHKHNPEFTMVEWYEAYTDYEGAMARTEEIVRAAAEAVGYEGELDFSAPWPRLGFVEAIRDATGIDLSMHRGAEELTREIRDRGLDVKTSAVWFEMADDLLSKYVEPALERPTFIVDYPKEISPLARERPDDPDVVERFEAFAGGMEIANGFSELIDADEQRERFAAQERIETLETGEAETMPYDEAFVQALEQGMPPTGGVGLGVDRLVMLLTGRDSIREVVLFPAMRD
ncbi:MAG TPA: lysine--tRNA ligase [Solirubrobacteraceae bacterium]|jgi:lysyl-tRNA synthetase class 2|nr:lysine--tRNA ligase [Solirubrobacteraceae bacterium]